MIHFPTLNDPASKCNTHTIGSDLPSSIQHFIPHIIPSISIPRLSQSRDDKDLPPPNPPPPPRPSSQIAALPPPVNSKVHYTLPCSDHRFPWGVGVPGAVPGFDCPPTLKLMELVGSKVPASLASASF